MKGDRIARSRVLIKHGRHRQRSRKSTRAVAPSDVGRRGRRRWSGCSCRRALGARADGARRRCGGGDSGASGAPRPGPLLVARWRRRGGASSAVWSARSSVRWRSAASWRGSARRVGRRPAIAGSCESARSGRRPRRWLGAPSVDRRARRFCRRGSTALSVGAITGGGDRRRRRSAARRSGWRRRSKASLRALAGEGELGRAARSGRARLSRSGRGARRQARRKRARRPTIWCCRMARFGKRWREVETEAARTVPDELHERLDAPRRAAAGDRRSVGALRARARARGAGGAARLPHRDPPWARAGGGAPQRTRWRRSSGCGWRRCAIDRSTPRGSAPSCSRWSRSWPTPAAISTSPPRRSTEAAAAPALPAARLATSRRPAILRA